MTSRRIISSLMAVLWSLAVMHCLADKATAHWHVQAGHAEHHHHPLSGSHSHHSDEHDAGSHKHPADSFDGCGLASSVPQGFIKLIAAKPILTAIEWIAAVSISFDTELFPFQIYSDSSPPRVVSFAEQLSNALRVSNAPPRLLS